MTWLTPLTGLIAASVVIPPLVALWFLRLRRRRREVSSTLLWHRSVEDLQANTPWQRLRPNLLLLLQILVLAALAIAVAQPILEGGAGRGRTVLLIDRSASMQAVEEGTSRLERARVEARRRAEELLGGGWLSGGDAEVMVIAFDDRAEVQAPFSDDARSVIEAIDRIRPSDGGSALRPALDLARAFATTTDPEDPAATSTEPLSLEVISDGRVADLEQSVLREGESLRFVRVGEQATPNAGIEVAAAERPADRPGSIAVFAGLFNAGREPVELRATLSVDGAVRAVSPRPIAIPAATTGADGRLEPGRAEVAFPPFEQPRDSLIEIRVAPAAGGADPLASDDRAAIVVPPPRRLAVLRVGEPGGLLQTLLEGLPLARIEAEPLARFNERTTVEPFDVVVLDGVRPDQLPPGAYLAFGPAAPIEGLEEFGERSNALVRSSRGDHELFRNVTLDELFVGSWRLIAPRGDVEVLAESSGGPLILWIDRGATKVLQVAFDPLDSNWPLLRSFVNFTANAIEHLGADEDAAALGGLVPGQAITARLPAGASQIRLVAPDGEEFALEPGGDGTTAWGPARLAGVHELRWREPGGEGRRRVAVNRLGAEEGRLDAAESLELGDETITGTSARGGRLDLWPWLLGVGLVLLFVEWIVYQRRAAA